MTKEQMQKLIFKEKADYCGFDFKKELHEIIHGGFTYEDFICNPSAIVVDGRYKNASILEDVLISIVRLIDKESVNHVYTMNFGRVINITDKYLTCQFCISETSNGNENLQIMFCNANVDVGYYNLRGYNLLYFIMKSKEYGTSIVFSSANGWVRDEDTPFTSAYLIDIYDRYVYNVLKKNDDVPSSAYQYTSFLDEVDLDDFTDGELYNAQDIKESIIGKAKKYVEKTIKHVEKEKEKKRKEEERIEEENRIEKERIINILHAYGKKYNIDKIPLRTNYTVGVSTCRDLHYKEIKEAQEKNIEFLERVKKRMERSRIDYNSLSKKDKELYLKFPNVKSIQELHRIQDLREVQYPDTFYDGTTFIDIESGKTVDNFTKEPNIFYIKFGVVSWITDKEALDLLSKEDIYEVLVDCAMCKKKYHKFKKYLEKGVLYISNITAFNGTITIVMGMKGDYYYYEF